MGRAPVADAGRRLMALAGCAHAVNLVRSVWHHVPDCAGAGRAGAGVVGVAVRAARAG